MRHAPRADFTRSPVAPARSLRPAFWHGQPLQRVAVADAALLARLAATPGSGVRRIDLPQAAAARAGFIRTWAARALGGLAGALLVLPLAGLAQAADYVAATAIEGVDSVTMMADGSVRLGLANGRVVTIAAESVQVTAAGEVLISAAAAEGVVAAAASAALAGGAGLAALGGLAGLGAAMGGGGSGGGSDPEPEPLGLGQAIDGYIALATVFRDSDGDGVLDPGEAATTTDALGNFDRDEVAGSGRLVAFGGYDIATGQPFTGILTAPEGAEVITPLTTLVQALVEDGQSVEEAEAAIRNSLGLDGDLDLLTADPVALADDGDPAALAAAAQIANILILAEAAGADQGAVAGALADALAEAGGSSPLTDAAVIEGALREGGADGEVVADLAELLADANADLVDGDGPTIAEIERIQTAIAGDVAEAVVDGDLDDTTFNSAKAAAAPLTPAITSFDATINAADAAAGVTIEGTGRAGTTVTVAFGSAEATAVVDAEGDWSVTFAATAGAGITALPDDGAVTLSVTAAIVLPGAEGAADTTVTSRAVTRDVVIDTVAPAAPVATSFGGDAVAEGGLATVVNIAEAADGITLQGTAEAGSTVTVTLGTGDTQVTGTATATDGAFTVSFTDEDLTVADGTYDVALFATDALGNAGAPATGTITLDRVAPAAPGDLALVADTGASDSVTYNPNLSYSGEEQGATPEFSTDGVTWSAGWAPQDGRITVQVRQVDAAGNPSDPSAALTFTLDRVVATPTVALDEDTGTSDSDGLTSNGTLEVTGREGDATVAWQYSTDGTNWMDTQPPADGTYFAQARQTDLAGNVSDWSASFGYTVDTSAPTAPTVALVADTGISDGITRTPGVVAGDTESGATVTWQYSTDNGQTWTSGEPPATDGIYLVQARQIDAAGNESGWSASFGYTLDRQAAAPTVSLVADTGSDEDDSITRTPGLLAGGTESGATVEWQYSTDTGQTWTLGEPPATDGIYLVRARQTDLAGNVSDWSDAQGYWLDTIAAAPLVTLAEDTGISDSDGITRTPGVVAGGTESGASVTWQYSTDGGTTWTPGQPPAEGAYLVRARQTDPAGNVSDWSAPRAYTLDTTAPGTPTIATITGIGDGDNEISLDDAANGVTLTGTADAGGMVNIIFGGFQRTVTANDSGVWTVTVPAESVFGPQANITAQGFDLAGNTGTSAATTVDVEQPPPVATFTLSASADLTALLDQTLFDTGVRQDAGAEGITVLSTDGAMQLQVTGTGLTWDTSGPFPTATAGTYTGLRIVDVSGPLPVEVMAITGLSLNAAATEHAVGTDFNRPAGDWPNLWALVDRHVMTVTGSAGNDAVRGGDHDDSFAMGAGDDTITGSAGDDTIDGGEGWDQVSYAGVAAGGVVADLATGTVTAVDGSFVARLIGIEHLRGTQDDDTLTGGNGDETFWGLGGADVIDGGSGSGDRVSYFRDAEYGSTAGVSVDLAQGRATDGFGNTDTLSGIEEVVGTDTADTILMDGQSNLVAPNLGNDTLDGRGGFDWLDYHFLVGSAGIDANLARGTVIGAGFVDQITGFEAVMGTANDDTLTGDGTGNSFMGLAGDDTIDGGDGWRGYVSYFADAALGGTAGVTVNLAQGWAIDGFGDTDSLANIFWVTGTQSADALTGDDLGNTFRSYEGADTIDGGGGFDWAVYSSAEGAVTADLLAGTVTFDGNTHRLISIEGLTGSAGDDTMTGSAADNTLQGRAGDDRLDGGAGWDMVSYSQDEDSGGLGAVNVNLAEGWAIDGFGNTDALISIEEVIGTRLADTITGSAGENYFYASLGDDTIDGGAGWDTVQYDDLGLTGGITAILGDGTDFGTVTRNGGGFTQRIANIEALRGSEGADSLTGNSGNNMFRGLAGADTIDGGDGWDEVRYDRDANYGGTAGVSVNLATGVAVDGFGHTDRLISIDQVLGTAAADTMTGSDASEIFTLGAGADVFNVSGGHDVVTDFVFGTDEIAGVSEDAVPDVLASATEITWGDGPAVTVSLGDNRFLTFAGYTLRQFQDATANEPPTTAQVTANGEAYLTDLLALTVFAEGDALAPVGGGLTLFSVDGALAADLLGTGVWAPDDEGNLVPSAGSRVTGVSFRDVDSGVTILSISGIDLDAQALNLAVDTDFGNGWGNWPTFWALLEPYGFAVTGSAGLDEVEGSTQDDTFAMGAGDDFVLGSAGDDTIDGGDGWDQVGYHWLGLTGGITVTLGEGTAAGTAVANDGSFTDTLVNIEALRGSEGADSLTGNSGDNMFRGLAGADTIDGGDGWDEVRYDRDANYGGTAGVSVNLATGVAVDGFGHTDTLISIEIARGSQGDDTFRGSDGDDTFRGLGGADVFHVSGGHDVIAGFSFAEDSIETTLTDAAIAAAVANATGTMIDVIPATVVTLPALGTLTFLGFDPDEFQAQFAFWNSDQWDTDTLNALHNIPVAEGLSVNLDYLMHAAFGLAPDPGHEFDVISFGTSGYALPVTDGYVLRAEVSGDVDRDTLDSGYEAWFLLDDWGQLQAAARTDAVARGAGQEAVFSVPSQSADAVFLQVLNANVPTPGDGEVTATAPTELHAIDVDNLAQFIRDADTAGGNLGAGLATGTQVASFEPGQGGLPDAGSIVIIEEALNPSDWDAGAPDYLMFLLSLTDVEVIGGVIDDVVAHSVLAVGNDQGGLSYIDMLGRIGAVDDPEAFSYDTNLRYVNGTLVEAEFTADVVQSMAPGHVQQAVFYFDMLAKKQIGFDVFGTAGDDTLYGSTLDDDWFFPGAGDDTIDISQGGTDRIYLSLDGGQGVKTITGFTIDTTGAGLPDELSLTTSNYGTLGVAFGTMSGSLDSASDVLAAINASSFDFTDDTHEVALLTDIDGDGGLYLLHDVDGTTGVEAAELLAMLDGIGSATGWSSSLLGEVVTYVPTV